MLAWFALTLFTSATLLFWVQPMVGKMVLPLLGGTPAVWNTCMFFFQAFLLLGYLYAHAATRFLGLRRQALLHLSLMLLCLLVLPISIAGLRPPPAEHNPIPWLLLGLLRCAGLPFLVVSASAPLLQKWFSTTDHPAAADPYFLYAASNLGSFLSLLGYPLLIEPHLLLRQQGRWWEAGFLLLIVLLGGCALLLVRSTGRRAPAGAPVADTGPRMTLGARANWVVLAFVPSSLMLGTTTHLSIDIAAVPLLWAIPLSLYLLTFILAFGKLPALLEEALLRLLPGVLILIGVLTLLGHEYRFTILPLHLVAFFLMALGCHAALFRSRPAAEHLTEFYLWLSLGGALGGLCNGLLAPVLFTRTTEYPLMVAVACVLLLSDPARGRCRGSRLLPVLDVGAALAATFATLALITEEVKLGPLHLGPGRLRGGLWTLFLGGLPWVLLYGFSLRAVRIGLFVGAILFGCPFFREQGGDLLHSERDFFGVLRVKDEGDGHHRLLNGTTLHGRQSMDPDERREPLTYYHRTGPVGQVFATLTGERRPREIAIIGLGAGTLAAYGEPGERLSFYEIDPAIERIARDPRYFTYLSDCGAAYRVVLGDARLRLAEAPDGQYDLIIIDAFGSDSIPVHLLTREALRLYLAKLSDRGLVLFHISNRFFALAKVLGSLAKDAGLFGLIESDGWDPRYDKTPSQWVVLARHEEPLYPLAEDDRWESIPWDRRYRLWTDDFSDPLSVLVWK